MMPTSASTQWIRDHDAMLYDQSSSSQMPHHPPVRHDDVHHEMHHYPGGERDVPRPFHRATAINSSSEYANYALSERYGEGAPASSREPSVHEHEYESNKTSLGFIMNHLPTAALPPPPHYRSAYSRSPPRDAASEATPYEPVPSSMFTPSAVLPPTRPMPSVRHSVDLGPIYREADRDTRLLLRPPLESRRRAVSTRVSTAAEAADTLARSLQTAIHTKKPEKKTRKVPASTTSKTIGYEEKRRSRECRINGCENYIINKGLCFRHGGGKKCSEDGCTSSAKHAGKCWKHGGSVKCLVDGCERRGKSRGFCWAHGGGTKCSDASCSKVAVSNGFCWAHGGGKRCAYEGCKKAAYERTYNYCFKHHDQLKDGSEILEV